MYFNKYFQALDLLLERMKEREFPFKRVVSLSGCGQQHGSVYWKKGSEQSLKDVKQENSLHEQLQARSYEYL